jgi:hypothetical protein
MSSTSAKMRLSTLHMWTAAPGIMKTVSLAMWRR